MRKMGKQVHVVMLPWSAFGHLIPFRLAAIAMAKCGVKVTFVSTPKNISRLPNFPDSLKELLSYVAIPLPASSTDPDPLNGGEATSDIPVEKLGLLKAAYDGLRDPFEELLVQLSPDWIIHDVISCWAPAIARNHSIPSVFFITFPSAPVAFLCKLPEGGARNWPTWESLTSPPHWFNFPSTVAYNKPEAIMYYSMLYGDSSSGMTDADRIHKAMRDSTVIGIRASVEYEGEFLKVVEKDLKKPVIPFGLLLPDEEPKKANWERDRFWKKTFDWLDEQPEKAVVYVAFGSEFQFSREHIKEIAYGLDISRQPFLWSLRRPSWAIDDDDVLPEGFIEMISGRGVVSFGWSPQLDVLGHRAVGGCLIHGGWGSVVESLYFGHNLIILPGSIDQPLNARLLVERGIGVEIEKKDDGSVTREDVSEAVKHAMVSEAGKEMRIITEDFRLKIFANRQLQTDYIVRFVHFLHNNLTV